MENMEIDELFDDIDTAGAGDGNNDNPDGNGDGVDGGAGDGAGNGSGDGSGDGADGGTGEGAGSGDGADAGTGDGSGTGAGTDGDDGAGNGSGDGKEGDDSIDHLSGIERYLAKFDIEGGMIEFEDGEKKHFTELEPDKQAEILQQLHEESAASIEEKYGLDEQEISLINYMRQTGKGVAELIDEEVNNRLQEIVATQQMTNTDIDKLDSDVIYKAFLLRSNPEATQDQINEDLEKAKAMTNYDKIVTNLRNDLKREQEYEIARQQQEQRQQLVSEIESQRAEVVKAIKSMDTVDGFKINDDLKNLVLDNILTVDDDGDSKFMVEVFGDPKNLFRAAFWYLNGPDIIRTREEYWKQQKSEAFKRGQESKGNGGKISFSKDKPHQDNKDPGAYDPESLDDLY